MTPGELRAVVFEWAGNRCEHPANYPTSRRCPIAAAELAHIFPRGMGHTGYRNTFDNVMAACTVHARSTDDLSSLEWARVPPPHDRKALAEWLRRDRVRRGYGALELFNKEESP